MVAAATEHKNIFDIYTYIFQWIRNRTESEPDNGKTQSGEYLGISFIMIIYYLLFRYIIMVDFSFLSIESENLNRHKT